MKIKMLKKSLCTLLALFNISCVVASAVIEEDPDYVKLTNIMNADDLKQAEHAVHTQKATFQGIHSYMTQPPQGVKTLKELQDYDKETLLPGYNVLQEELQKFQSAFMAKHHVSQEEFERITVEFSDIINQYPVLPIEVLDIENLKFHHIYNIELPPQWGIAFERENIFRAKIRDVMINQNPTIALRGWSSQHKCIKNYEIPLTQKIVQLEKQCGYIKDRISLILTKLGEHLQRDYRYENPEMMQKFPMLVKFFESAGMLLQQHIDFFYEGERLVALSTLKMHNQLISEQEWEADLSWWRSATDNNFQMDRKIAERINVAKLNIETLAYAFLLDVFKVSDLVQMLQTGELPPLELPAPSEAAKRV